MAAALQPTTGRSQPQASASADLSRYRRPELGQRGGHSPAALSQQQHSLQHLRSSAASHRQRAGLRFCCHAPAHPFSHGFREAHTALQAQAGARHEPRLWGQPPASRSASAVRSMQQEQEADGIAQEGADEVAEEGEDEGGYPSDSGDDGVLIFGEAPEARKLRRFDGKRSIRHAVINFRYEATVDAGTLVVRPLTVEWLGRTADLLTDVFATLGGPGFVAYRRYMRNQIRGFLEMQLALMPDAVVLMALLTPHSAGGAPLSAGSGSVTTGPSDGAGGGAPEQQFAMVEPRFEGCGQEGTEATPAGFPGSPSVQSQGWESDSPVPEPAQRDRQGAAVGGPSPGSDFPAGPSGVAGAEGAAAAAAAAAAAGTAVGEGEDGAGGSGGGAEQLLVGTFELAFTDATRTKFVTLNPPQDGAYLSNMCTCPDHRQRGYGRHLLAAAEQLTRLTSYSTIYLHNRFKDLPAGALYKKCGYEVADKDNVLWGLLGQDRRFLLRKRVPGDGS